MIAPMRARLTALAALVWTLHAIEVLARGRPVELLWMCNVAGLVLVLGCALARARIVGVALSWLALGTPLWIGDLAAGGELYPTSLFSHWGGIAIGVAAIRALGWDRRTWWSSSAALLTLVLLTRLVPAAEPGNLNLAFRVWPGWERAFASYPPYFAFLFVFDTAVFYGVHRVAMRFARQIPP